MEKSEMFDVVIAGGGHNALTAAAYLAKAGLKVQVLEKLEEFGGAAVSQKPFLGIDAKLSRYAYLVSLLPKTIVEDLGLEITLAKRRYSSYTPLPGTEEGLLVDNENQAATEEAFIRLGAKEDAKAWGDFYSMTARVARTVFPTVTQPLATRSELRAMIQEATGSSSAWEALFERPIGEVIDQTFKDDLVKGVVLTDALIGTFAPNLDESFAANRCFLYHVIGGGTGDWNIPVGGMGEVSGALYRAAKRAGAELSNGCEVTAIDPTGKVQYRQGGEIKEVSAKYVLAGFSPRELARLTCEKESLPLTSSASGAQVKVNLLLKRLPKLKDQTVDEAAAFGGTFHINETWRQLQTAFEQASSGLIPDPLPLEIYCHSLTDPSILSPELQRAGVQTLTVFALHTPHNLISGKDPDLMREQLQEAVLRSLNSVLAENIEELVMKDANGNPCIETKTTADLEEALGLPAGNIFHGPLSWPFLEDDEPRDTPARRWGVETKFETVLLCGSGAKRGGAVSGIAGHNAAMAVLELMTLN